jgi:hypothetical protein|tara:strand:+ start:371 stop:535 length:165 start_codon:yes stop_codon:yes gene_type:complete
LLPTRNDSVPDFFLDEALALLGYFRDDLDTSLLKRTNAGTKYLFIPPNRGTARK